MPSLKDGIEHTPLPAFRVEEEALFHTLIPWQLTGLLLRNFDGVAITWRLSYLRAADDKQ